MEKTAYEEYVAGKDVNLTADSDSVKSYLADMGNIELLSACDENRLSERTSDKIVIAVVKVNIKYSMYSILVSGHKFRYGVYHFRYQEKVQDCHR